MKQLVTLTTQEETRKLAETFAARVGCGDLVTLAGDLGAGKTTFAQYFIRALSCNPAVEVTSPTFTLLQTYPVVLSDGAAAELYHYDLYRIEQASALTELGIEEALQHVVLMEWPERAASLRLPVSLAMTFVLQPDGARWVQLAGDEKWTISSGDGKAKA